MASSGPVSPNLSERLPMVGRRLEYARLHHVLDRMLSGYGSLVLVSGEAGIGKTTLVQALCEDATQRGCLVLSGGCYDLTSTPPYGPWTEIFFRRYRPGDRLPVLPAPLQERDLSSMGSQQELFDLILDFLTDVAARQPLVVVLEDLHWSDSDSLETLRWMSRWLADRRILIVATYRDDEITRRHSLYQLLPTLVRESAATRISLSALSSEALRELVAAQYDLEHTDADRLTDHLDRLGDGNPLFVGELLRGLEDEDVLRWTGEKWNLGPLRGSGVPPLLKQVIDSRLSRLNDQTHAALQTAAVIGQHFSAELWGDVSGQDQERFQSVIDEALRAGVLVEVREARELAFRHALIRERLYESLTLPHRRTHHGRVAERLMLAAQPDNDAVAHHLFEAGDRRAATWFVWAGFQAMRSFAWRAAITHLEHALSLMEREGECEKIRGWLCFHLGKLHRIADPGRSLAYFTDAISLATDTEDDALLACSTFTAGVMSINRMDFARGFQQIAEGIQLLEALPPAQRLLVNAGEPFGPTASPIVEPDKHGNGQSSQPSSVDGPLPRELDRRGIIATYLLGMGRTREAREWLAPYLDLGAPAFSGSDKPFNFYQAAATLYSHEGNVDGAQVQFQRMRASHKDRSPLIMLPAVWMQFDALLMPYQMDNLELRQHLIAAVDRAAPYVTDAIPSGWSPKFGLSLVAVIDGTWDELRSWADDIKLDGGPMLMPQRVSAALAAVAYYQGRWDECRRYISAVLPSGPNTEPGNVFILASSLTQQTAAQLAIDEGDFGEARAWIEAYKRWLSWSEIGYGQADRELLQARYARATGDPERSRYHAEQALQLAATPRQPLALIRAHRFLGEVETGDQRFETAAFHLEKSLRIAEACQAPYESALSRLALAEAALAERNTKAARCWIRSASGTFENLHAAPALTRLTAAQSRLSKLEGRKEYPAGLTGREVEVLRLVADGMTDAEAADRLYLSPRTVGVHLRSIYRKLDVNNRAEATRFAVESGILSDE